MISKKQNTNNSVEMRVSDGATNLGFSNVNCRFSRSARLSEERRRKIRERTNERKRDGGAFKSSASSKALGRSVGRSRGR